MKVVVCVKEIPDPESASALFRVDERAKKVIPVLGMPLVMSPFDAQAIEVALRLKDTLAGISIVLLTLGETTARSMIKQGLSLGADEAVLLVDSAFDGGDSYTTAYALATAIRRIGGVDLVLTGRQAADDDCGVVGCGIAEILGVPAVTLAMDVAVADGKLIVQRTLGDGTETVEAPMPAVVTVSHEAGNVRHASLRETMKAARKPVTIWTAADLALSPTDVGASAARRLVHRLYVPVNGTKCEFIAGNSAEEQAANLIGKLVAARLISRG